MDLGKLDKGAFLKAICAGFQETTEPTICLREGYHLLHSIYKHFLLVVSFETFKFSGIQQSPFYCIVGTCYALLYFLIIQMKELLQCC